jgi:lipopolysaccharide transport system ATP-binding protein
MSVITVEGLGKRYRLGGLAGGYGRLTESASNSLRRLVGKSVPQEDVRELWALRGASFDVEQGEVVGVVGRNGAGKSTLLKLLARITPPTEGRAEIHGRVGSLLEVGTGFHQELTGRENLYLSGAILGMKRSEITRKLDAIIDFAELERFIDTPVKRYSSGMGLRLAFSIAAHLEPEVLLVDEVLAVGDLRFREKCIGRIGEVSREDGRTVFFVSHDLNAVLATCKRVLLVDGGTIMMDGPAIDVVSHYEAQQSELARVDGDFARRAPSPRYPSPLFTRASIVSGDEVSGHVGHGAPWKLRLETTADSDVRQFGVDVRILDARHRPVTYISSIAMQDVYFAPGDTIELEIPYLPLATGVYIVELLAHVHGQGFDDWLDEIAFDVIRFDPFSTGSTYKPTPERGSIVPEHRWTSSASAG